MARQTIKGLRRALCGLAALPVPRILGFSQFDALSRSPALGSWEVGLGKLVPLSSDYGP